MMLMSDKVKQTHEIYCKIERKKGMYMCVIYIYVCKCKYIECVYCFRNCRGLNIVAQA